MLCSNDFLMIGVFSMGDKNKGGSVHERRLVRGNEGFWWKALYRALQWDVHIGMEVKPYYLFIQTGTLR